MGAEQGTQLADLLQKRMAEGFACELMVSVGDGCDVLLENGAFQYMAQELVDNCAEKATDDGIIQIQVRVACDDRGIFEMKVEDNVLYSAQELDRILKNLKKSHPARVGKADSRESEGGMGLRTCRTILGKWGGSLGYEGTADGRIVATARWKKTDFLKVTRKLP